jgi:AraC-like DNA-binding protein
MDIKTAAAEAAADPSGVVQTAGQERIDSWAVGAVRFARIVLPRPGMCATFQDASHHVCLMLQEHGVSALEYEGEKCSYEAGHWTYWSSDSVSSIRVHSHAMSTRVLVLSAKRERLEELDEEVLAEDSRIVRYENHPLLDTMRDLSGARGRLDALTASHIGTLLCRVVESVLGDQSRAQRYAASTNAARLNRVRQHILERLQDPQLSLDAIAEHAGCSKRFVQMMFAEYGETVTHFVLRKRLERVHLALTRSSQDITEIAVSSGFNDHSYFGRTYRRLFGISPSNVRRAYRVMRVQHTG